MQQCPDTVLINKATYSAKFDQDFNIVFSQDRILLSNSWWLCTSADNPNFSPQFLGHIKFSQLEIPPGLNWEEKKLQLLWSNLLRFMPWSHANGNKVFQQSAAQNFQWNRQFPRKCFGFLKWKKMQLENMQPALLNTVKIIKILIIPVFSSLQISTKDTFWVTQRWQWTTTVGYQTSTQCLRDLRWNVDHNSSSPFFPNVVILACFNSFPSLSHFTFPKSASSYISTSISGSSFKLDFPLWAHILYLSSKANCLRSSKNFSRSKCSTLSNNAVINKIFTIFTRPSES